MRTGTIAEIRRVENGFVVCATDPAIVKANRDPKKSYRSSEVEYAFTSLQKALAWIKANEATLVPEDDDEYATSFDQATAEK